MVVDDEIPVDIFGMPLLVGCRPLQLWPLLLTKALFKVMKAYKCLQFKTPRTVSALNWLTGWHYELLPITLESVGLVYDRIQEGVSRMHSDKNRTVVTCNLKKMATPTKAPPRMLVLCGPEGAGKELVSEYLESEFKGMGCCVSHTTRRPKQHEVDGKHHFFISEEDMLSKQENDLFLMHEDVYGGSFSRGYSLSTVRDVAASGLMCVLTVDVLGVRALKKRPGVDALYIYVGPQDLESYESYLRERLTEDESTINLRLEDAKQGIAKATDDGDVFDILIDRDYDNLYSQTKSVISQLSPVIRNRLKGLPAYVLDYADVIPSNSVERPVAKPVLLAGPPSKTKSKLVQDLMSEFPDVFCIPTIHTTSEDIALKNNEVLQRKRVNSLEMQSTESPQRKLYEYVTKEEYEDMRRKEEFLIVVKW